MKKKYDEFVKLNIKDMSKAMSDLTFEFINPETKKPTIVPAKHYESKLGCITEQYITDITKQQFLTIMFNQLSALKKEDERYFNQALMCIDLGLNPKDLRINEQIAIEYTYGFLEQKKSIEKKNFHFLSQDIVDTYNDSKNNTLLQSQVIRDTKLKEEQEYRQFKKDNFER